MKKFRGAKRFDVGGTTTDTSMDRSTPSVSSKLSDYYKANAIPLALSGMAGYAGGNKGIAAGAILPLLIKMMQAKKAAPQRAGTTSTGAPDMKGPSGLPPQLSPPPDYTDPAGINMDQMPAASPGAPGGYTGADDYRRGGAIKKAKGGMVEKKFGGGIGSLGRGVAKEDPAFEPKTEALNNIRTPKGGHHNYPKFRKEPLLAKETMLKAKGGAMKKMKEGSAEEERMDKKEMKMKSGGDCGYKKGGVMKKAEGGPCSGATEKNGPMSNHKNMAMGKSFKADGKTERYASGGAVRGWGISKRVPTGSFE